MMYKPSLLIAGLLCATPQINAEDNADKTRPSAPPPTCEIRQSAWCIAEGAGQIVRRFDEESHDIAWVLSSVARPNAPLVILEPNGCRKGYSDVVAGLDFGDNIRWHGKMWDRVRVRLKRNGSCDLTLLFPPFSGDSLEWAFSVGRALLMACRDEGCTPNGPTPADVTDQFGGRFQRPRSTLEN